MNGYFIICSFYLLLVCAFKVTHFLINNVSAASYRVWFGVFSSLFSKCYELNFSSLKFPCWSSNPRFMVLGDGAFRRWLGHESWVWGPYDGSWGHECEVLMMGLVPCRKRPESLPSFSPSLPCEVTTRKQPAGGEVMGLHQNIIMSAPWSQTSQPPELRSKCLCLSSEPMVFCYSSLS